MRKLLFYSALTALVIISSGCVHFFKMEPFIDVDESLLLSANMSKNTVLQYLGTPLETRAGIVLSNGSVAEIWLYNVKHKLYAAPVTDIDKKPPKSFKATNWSKENQYALFFVTDKLVKWGYFCDDWPDFDKIDGEILAPVKKVTLTVDTLKTGSTLFNLKK